MPAIARYPNGWCTRNSVRSPDVGAPRRAPAISAGEVARYLVVTDL